MRNRVGRADQVGSLPRSAEGLAARAAPAPGRVGRDDPRGAEGRAVPGGLAMQRDVGLDGFTDGERRRCSWLSALAEAVDGFVDDRVTLHWRGPGGGPELSTGRVV